MMILPVLLAGGIGKRLWPLSQSNHPKQFLSLIDENTLLQNSLQLVTTIPSIGSPFIICNEKQYLITAEQAKKILKTPTILLESQGHGTAAATLLAALYAMTQFGDPILLIQPSDSYIEDHQYYSNLIQSALKIAMDGKIVLFGIEISEPHTGYGYIKFGQEFSNTPGYIVDEFIEKPSLEKAQSFLESGKYFWNSGIFLFKASTIINEAKKYIPDLLAVCQRANSIADINIDFVRFNMNELDPSLNLSLDHAIMQKTQEAVVFPFRSNWADIGDWNMVWRILKKDKKNNVIKGQVMASDVENCYLQSESKLLIAIGIKNQAIINTSSALLVADIREGQRIKEVLDNIDLKAPESS